MAKPRSYHIRWPGVVYILITLLLGVGAINSQNNLLFIVFGLALGALLVSGVVSGAMLMGVSVHRRPLPPGVARRPIPVTYVVRNANRFIPAVAITIEETATVSLHTEAQAGGGDRVSVAAFVTRVPTRRSARARTVLTPPRRGHVRLDAVTVTATFPLGVFRKSVVFPQRGATVAAPEPVACRPDAVRHGPDRRPRDQRTAARQGAGDEFYGLRDYTPGDPTRMIAWKPSARADSLVVRQNLAVADASLELTLVRDAPAASAGPGEPAERTLSLIMGLADASLRAGRFLSVRVAGDWASPIVVESHAELAALGAALGELDTLAPPHPATPPDGRLGRAVVVRLSDPGPLEPAARAAPEPAA